MEVIEENANEKPEIRFERILASVRDEERSWTAAGREQAAPRPAGASATRPIANDLTSSPTVVSPALSDTQPVIAGTKKSSPGQEASPAHVNQRDLDATRVTEAAYFGVVQAQKATAPSYPPPGASAAPSSSRAYPTAPGQSGQASAAKSSSKRQNQPKAKRSNLGGCLIRTALVGLIGVVLVLLGGLMFAFYQYYQIAAQLPNIGDLRQKAAQFETTRILDRNGNVLYEILDPTAGRRTYVPLDKISPYLVAATLATEDKGFYSHPGFDLGAIGRAFLQNAQTGGVASGASTITQQLARTLLFTPEERVEQSYRRKVREAILAAEITRRYTKDEILELYLNENYYGNLAYGVEAAAETYFGVSADQLTFAQAAFLAGLPQAPSVYDVYTSPEVVFNRLEDVLTLIYQDSQEQGCIYVSNSPQRVCVDPVMVVEAVNEIKNTQFTQQAVQMRFPHWVTYIRSLLEAQYDPQTIYRSGFQVYTTLDPDLQEAAETIVKEQVASMVDQRATDGALVSIQPSTGEILAMVGSADFYNEEIDGQVNMAVSPRQPGSAMKPLTYLAAFEKGWTPATLLWDVPTEFTPSGKPDDPGPAYEPVNYDGEFHGPVTVRSALANSFNIPAVKALQFVGIYDDPTTPIPDGFINFAKRLGITSLTRDDYGLSLTLGGGDVSLLELTGAYAAFANSGRRIPPVAITKITDFNGNIVYEYKPSQGEQVLRPEHAFLVSSILSDNEARQAMFGRNSVLNLPFDAAAKTGTTNDYRDNWTVGYTPDLVTGVWVGNADYTPMIHSTGLSGAAPIWSQFMSYAVPEITGGAPTSFNRPGGIIEQVICAISGTFPSEWCPEETTEIFVADQPPLPSEKDLWQKPVIDTWTGLIASNDCQDFLDDPLVLSIDDPAARKWIRKDAQGQSWAEQMGFSDPVQFAPERECRADDPRPKLVFVSPRDGDTINQSPLEIWAVADATDWFDSVRLEVGKGEDPQEWFMLAESDYTLREPEMIYRWDLTDLEPGVYTLRLFMKSTEDTYAERRIRLNIQVPTPTPVPTETPLPTATPTFTPLPSDTPLPLPTETPPPPLTTEIFPKATDTPAP
jgi:penicillin-binding protein 1C